MRHLKVETFLSYFGGKLINVLKTIALKNAIEYNYEILISTKHQKRPHHSNDVYFVTQCALKSL